MYQGDVFCLYQRPFNKTHDLNLRLSRILCTCNPFIPFKHLFY